MLGGAHTETAMLKSNMQSYTRYIAMLVLAAVALPAVVVAEPIVLIADRIVDGKSGKALRDAAIVVEGQSIIAIGDRALVPENATVFDLGDATLMPGMIDAHMHPQLITGDYQSHHLQRSSAYKTLRATVVLQQNLMAGWTGIRVVGDGDVFYGDVDIKRAIEEGTIIGPHMAVAGHYLSITGGGGDINYMSPEQSLIADGLVVDGVEEIRRAIRTEIKYGSDWIKILATGAYQSVGDDPHNLSFSPEEFQAAVDEANRQGVPVAAHAHATAGIKQAVLAGVRSIEHGTFLDDEVIDLMAEKGTWLIPTIYIGDYYENEGTLREDERNTYYIEHERPTWIRWLGQAHRKGVKIGVGLDFGTGYKPNVYAREFAVLTEIGMSNMEAIQAGTRVNAEMLGWDDKLGSLEVGKLADIIAIPGNPLEDIALLENVSFVMLGGRVIKAPGAPEPTQGMLLH
jgi:imidazolonepropionase-like amidohydrolase